MTYSDEYGVIYVGALIEGLGWGWTSAETHYPDPTA
jgi:hypothetical protein